MLAHLSDLATQSRAHLLTPLHPENVAAQHRAPLKRLRTKYSQLLALLDKEGNAGRLTERLSREEQARFVEVREVLGAEKELLGVAERWAGRWPHCAERGPKEGGLRGKEVR